jgi:CxxC motif-containing protein
MPEAKTEQFVCIGCPMGCPLQLVHEGSEIREVSGHECNRGAKYARQEFTEPRRGLSTTVRIAGARWDRLPVKVAGQVHKARVREAARAIHALRVEAPVRLGQVLLKDLLGEKGLDVVATRSMERATGGKASS